MISYLKGNFIGIISGKATIEVDGVGFGVRMPEKDLTKLSKGSQVSLFVHTFVRQDTLELYGFFEKEGLELFELLLGVSGVGPKSALAIVDRGAEQVRQAISKADVGFFTSIPRIGKKNAQRIIVDLKSKIGSLKELELGEESVETQELMEALKTLGFTRKEVLTIIPKIPDNVVVLEEKISFCLRTLGKN